MNAQTTHGNVAETRFTNVFPKSGKSLIRAKEIPNAMPRQNRAMPTTTPNAQTALGNATETIFQNAYPKLGKALKHVKEIPSAMPKPDRAIRLRTRTPNAKTQNISLQTNAKPMT